jgi:predicted ATPase
MEKVFVSSLDLKEFRGIKEIQEPLELTKFNVLLGRNNSGKSAILHALSLLPHPRLELPMCLKINYLPPMASPKATDILKWEKRKGIFDYLLGGSDSAIYRYAGTAVLDFLVKGKSCQVKISRREPEILVEGKRIDIADWLKQLGIEGERGKDAVAFVPNDSTFFQSLKVNSKQNWSIVEKSGAHYWIVRDIINKSVNETFTEVNPREDGLYVRKEVNGGVPFYVKVRDLGDGVKKILSVLLWLETSSPELVLWDDFEASVHPTLIKLVLEWLMKKDWQVVLTTHSIDTLLKLLELDTGSKDSSIILLQKTPEDILLHKRHSLEELENFVIANQDPRLLSDLLKL